jgi:hypothetical protein
VQADDDDRAAREAVHRDAVARADGGARYLDRHTTAALLTSRTTASHVSINGTKKIRR